MAPAGAPFVRVTRGALVESVHAVAACAADTAGTVVLACGDIDAPIYLRSAAKPFIAAAIVAAGTAERFGLGQRELAVIAASHGGEAFHVEAVLEILERIGLDRSALQCGVHPPSYEPAAAALVASAEPPTALHNNCSGKHAGMLAMCVHLGCDPATYLEPAHPVQQRIIAFCAELLDVAPADLPLGTDGCGMPVFATSLRRAARAFARFATVSDGSVGQAAALRSVRSAMAAEAAYVAGTGRFDTALLEATAGRVVGKAGAEGVHGDALRREELGLVLKVVDGSRRALAPAAVALLRELGALEPAEVRALHAFAEPVLRNAAGRVVGEIAGRVPDTISQARTS